METATLEERVTALEAELAQLKRRLATDTPKSTVPWWERNFGAFADSEDYDEAMRLGREYRESLRPKDDGTDGDDAGRIGADGVNAG